jgi:hypothetical protein
MDSIDAVGVVERDNDGEQPPLMRRVSALEVRVTVTPSQGIDERGIHNIW